MIIHLHLSILLLDPVINNYNRIGSLDCKVRLEVPPIKFILCFLFKNKLII